MASRAADQHTSSELHYTMACMQCIVLHHGMHAMYRTTSQHIYFEVLPTWMTTDHERLRHIFNADPTSLLEFVSRKLAFSNAFRESWDRRPGPELYLHNNLGQIEQCLLSSRPSKRIKWEQVLPILEGLVLVLRQYLEANPSRPSLHIDIPYGNIVGQIARWNEVMVKHFRPGEREFQQVKDVVIGCIDQLIADHTARAEVA